MTIQKRYLVGSGLAMALWFGVVTWGTPVIRQYPLTATHLNTILVAGTVAFTFTFYYRSKTTDPNEKKLLGRMLLYTTAGILFSLASTWALRQA